MRPRVDFRQRRSLLFGRPNVKWSRAETPLHELSGKKLPGCGTGLLPLRLR
jgi:hypothetical protein